MSWADGKLKAQVQQHWESETCGTRYGTGVSRKEYFEQIFQSRYQRTPYIRDFAGFGEARGKRVLEIGVGAGSDFRNWVSNGAIATGIDLTEAAISQTREHLILHGFDDTKYELLRTDAENLPFAEGTFDIVYSYGVLHHTPDTAAAFAEVFRVLKPGGELRAMIYHVPSWTGLMLWWRYSVMRCQPWQSQRMAIYEHLESPGTKAYTVRQARRLLSNSGFHNVTLRPKLCPGDLLNIQPSARYQARVYRIVWALYPRWLVNLMGDRLGLNLLICAQKPARQ